MWKLNKLDVWIVRKINAFNKWMINSINGHPIRISICVLILFALVFVVAVLFSMHDQQSPEYIKGYNDGFSEMNVTKYNVAIAVTENNGHRINSNSEYVNGYMRGYNAALLEKADIIMGTKCST